MAFVLHGWGKVTNISGFAVEQGVPVVLGAAAAYVQFIGGLLLLGLLTPLAAFGIGVTMAVAVVMLVRAGESSSIQSWRPKLGERRALCYPDAVPHDAWRGEIRLRRAAVQMRSAGRGQGCLFHVER